MGVINMAVSDYSFGNYSSFDPCKLTYFIDIGNYFTILCTFRNHVCGTDSIELQGQGGAGQARLDEQGCRCCRCPIDGDFVLKLRPLAESGLLPRLLVPGGWARSRQRWRKRIKRTGTSGSPLRRENGSP